jgi:hypothetical protein
MNRALVSVNLWCESHRGRSRSDLRRACWDIGGVQQIGQTSTTINTFGVSVLQAFVEAGHNPLTGTTMSTAENSITTRRPRRAALR